MTEAGREHEAARDRAVAAADGAGAGGEALAGLDETVGRLWSGLAAGGGPRLVAAGPVGERGRLGSSSGGWTDGALPGAGLRAHDDDRRWPSSARAPWTRCSRRSTGSPTQAAAGDAAVRTARRERAVAAGASTAAREVRRRGRRAAGGPGSAGVVRCARPSPGTTVLAGWTTLLAWARAEAASGTGPCRRPGRPPRPPRPRWRAADRQRAVPPIASPATGASDETAAARAEQEARDAVAVSAPAGRRSCGPTLAGAPTEADRSRPSWPGATSWRPRRPRRRPSCAPPAASCGTAERAAADIARRDRRRLAGPARGPRPAGRRCTPRPSRTTTCARPGARSPAGPRAGAGAGDEQLPPPTPGRANGRAGTRRYRRPAGRRPRRHAVRVGRAGWPSRRCRPSRRRVERARGRRQRLVERRAAATRAWSAERDAAAERPAGGQDAGQPAALATASRAGWSPPRWTPWSPTPRRGSLELSGGQFELTHGGGEFLVVDHADADARAAGPDAVRRGDLPGQPGAGAGAVRPAVRRWPPPAPPGSSRSSWTRGSAPSTRPTWRSWRAPWRTWPPAATGWSALITHVPALAERVPVRFAVRRDERTSSVVRENRRIA